MAVHRLTKVVQYLCRSSLPDDPGVSDSQLLDQFIEHQDESAFAVLVRRHSPMVWGVCRRIVAHHQDAEDAFQATILVLARKATSIRPRALVANWLFGVAQRTALKSKTMAGKRRAREKQVTTMPEPAAVAQNSWENLAMLIDQELATLPDKYRCAIVLCDLEGKTGKAVARQLRIPEGTLSTRLRTARVLLAKRLARHGLMLSGGALATMLTHHAASASAPTLLVSATIKAATLAAAGKTVAAGTISANAAALTEGVMQAMLLTKLKTVMSVLLVLGLVAFVGGLFSRHTAAGQEVEEFPGNGSVLVSEKIQVAEPQRPGSDQSTKKEGAKIGPGKVQKFNYSVADLVIPIQGLDFPWQPTKHEEGKTKEDWLINKITRTVAPDTWKEAGGAGTIHYSAPDTSLVVNNTERVQAQIRYLLETMRRVQDVQVSAETRILALKGDSFLKVRELLPQLKMNDHIVLDEAEAFALVRKAQDDADAKVVRAPKITFFPGQQVSVSVDSGKELPRIKKMDVQISALVAANLLHVDLEVKARVGKADFNKAIRLEDGATLAQVKRHGDDYLLFLVTPRVILNLEVEDTSSGISPRLTPPKKKGGN